MKGIVQRAGADFPASIVVFLVALPLCLGVAVASDAAPVTGIIAGIAGGIVIGVLSGSPLSVSGPAAGLTAIVAGAIGKLPAYEMFLVSVILAGALQLILGFLKAGVIGDFVPNSVIKGMLAAIGLILILKQLPHFVGYDADPEGDFYFFQPDHENTFTGLLSALRYFEPGAVLVGFISALVLWLYNLKALKTGPFSKLLPGPLVVVVAGVLINKGLAAWYPALLIGGDHLVQLPVSANPASFFAGLPKPQFQGLLNPQVWITALTLAIVASLETLLSIEAVDKLDPQKRISPTNRELKAQGMGNLVSGLLGGLPVTSVIVRSSANVQAGAQSKLSAIMHGVWLLLSVLFFPQVLSMIPKASLAAILIFTGYKLANITLLKEYFRKGSDQSIPFFVTIGAILISDLLTGIIVGIIAGLFFVLRSNFRTSVFVVKDELRYLVRFRKEVSFLNKAYVKKIFEQMPDNVAVLIDATKSEFIDKDIVELVNDFIVNAETRGIRVYIKYGPGHSQTYFNDISKRVIQ